MGEVAVENGQISDFQALITLTLTLDRVILHTVMHHSSTSTTCQISLKLKKRFVDGWTDRRMNRRTNGHLRPTLLGRLGGVNLKTAKVMKK